MDARQGIRAAMASGSARSSASRGVSESREEQPARLAGVAPAPPPVCASPGSTIQSISASGSMMMKKRVSRNWVHLCVWLALGAYLALSGSVRAALAVNVGTAIPIMLGSARVQSAISLTFREPTVTRVDGQEVYLLWGSAPPGGTELPADRQATGIVLLDDHGAALLFESQGITLPSTNPSLRLEERDLAASVVSTYISGVALRRGAYRVGVVYTGSSGDIVLLMTDRFLVRTPNTLRIFGYRPSVRHPIEDPLLRLRLAAGTIPPTLMAYDFFELAEGETEAAGTYRLLGYAFPFGVDAPVDRYQKRILLIGEDLAPHLFDAETIIRADVAEYYASLGMQVDASGFGVEIAEDALDPGLYRLAILFTAEGLKPAYWPTDRYIQFTGDAVLLLPRGTPNR